MLLFWPCAWGLSIAYDFQNSLDKYLFYLVLFFFGSVLMRSAGCIVNDIIDKDFDKKVARTKNRPIASGKISVRLSLLYSGILCLLAFFVLINFNNLTILLAIISMPFAFTYPLMKRYTYWPQLFLGVTFNYGLILGWTSIVGDISYIPIIFYLGAIFWTLGYDTIYGFQDIEDDEIIGVKSTSIKFKENPKIFLTLCYLIFSISFITTGILLELNVLFYILMAIILFHLFYFQISKFDSKNSMKCLKIFKSNNFFGFLVLINVLIGKLLII
tara:strand:- start:2092 stop:2907 length:816 start_codon:yes stop_codon:yes gene_type:complete